MNYYIQKKDLKEGFLYQCDARNFEIGKWNGEAFEYTRTKFGDVFQDEELHYDDGAPHGTVKPIKEII